MRFKLPLIFGLSTLAGLPLAATVEGAPANNATQSQFDKADLDKDGSLNQSEVSKAFRGLNFKAIDQDGDKLISRAEFEKYEKQAAADAKQAAEQMRRAAQQQQQKQQQLQQTQQRLLKQQQQKLRQMQQRLMQQQQQKLRQMQQNQKRR